MRCGLLSVPTERQSERHMNSVVPYILPYSYPFVPVSTLQASYRALIHIFLVRIRLVKSPRRYHTNLLAKITMALLRYAARLAPSVLVLRLICGEGRICALL
jgi:hypothetical protein